MAQFISKLVVTANDTLRTLLTRIGAPTTGTKPVLSQRLLQELRIPRLRHHLLSPKLANGKKTLRILSIDMGIKNLAFCVADVKVGKTMVERTDPFASAKMEIVAWRRLDVKEEVERTNASLSSNRPRDVAPQLETEGLGEDEFSPSGLARTAYSIVNRTLLTYAPDVVLIERQRWRSGGSAAIQQWTVRVNLLEGMFWALLTAVQRGWEHPNFPKTRATLGIRNSEDVAGTDLIPFDVFAVDPKRVAGFWMHMQMAQNLEIQTPKSAASDTNAAAVGPEEERVELEAESAKPDVKRRLSKGKVEKKMKIQLVQSLLSAAQPTIPPYHASKASLRNRIPYPDLVCTPVMFSFTPEAELTRKAVCLPVSTKSKQQTKQAELNESVDIPKLKKLDDVADCFLQAVAWVVWEGNRLGLLNEYEEDQRMQKKRYKPPTEKPDGKSKLQKPSLGVDTEKKGKKGGRRTSKKADSEKKSKRE